MPTGCTVPSTELGDESDISKADPEAGPTAGVAPEPKTGVANAAIGSRPKLRPPEAGVEVTGVGVTVCDVTFGAGPPTKSSKLMPLDPELTEGGCVVPLDGATVPIPKSANADEPPLALA